MSTPQYSTQLGDQPARVADAGVPQPNRLRRVLDLVDISRPNLARLVLGLLLLVLLCLAWFGNNPSAGGNGVSNWKSSSAAAAASNELNGSKTSGAPQQAVVNGWYANDLANVQISQNTYTAVSSARNSSLLDLLVQAITGELVIRSIATIQLKSRRNEGVPETGAS